MAPEISLFNISIMALAFWNTSLRASDCEKVLLACLNIVAVPRIITVARDIAMTTSISVKAECLWVIDNCQFSIVDFLAGLFKYFSIEHFSGINVSRTWFRRCQ